MKLTDYIKDLGRAVAYYPKLKNITGSTTSSILLCQLLYWSDKTTDAWIWKTSDELEEETGLTYNEQRTARKNLKTLGLITEWNARTEHVIKFKINQDVLNTLWEEQGGIKIEPIKTKKTTSIKSPLQQVLPEILPEEKKEVKSYGIVERTETLEEVNGSRSDVKKKGDMLDGILASQNYSGSIKSKEMGIIKEKIEHKLNIFANNIRWQNFIEFAWKREKNHNQPVDVFLSWALKEGFDPLYWTPEKMQTMYPQAFMKATSQPEDTFVKPMPEIREVNRVPMPKEAKLNRPDLVE